MISPDAQVPGESPDSLAPSSSLPLYGPPPIQSGSPARASWTHRHLLLLPHGLLATGIWSNWSRRDRRGVYVCVETRHTDTDFGTPLVSCLPWIQDVVPGHHHKKIIRTRTGQET